MTVWVPATSEVSETLIDFLRAERNSRHDHAFVHPKAVERCCRTGKAWRAVTDSGEVVGVALGTKRTLWNLIVRSDHRGQGLGTSFLHALQPDFIRVKKSTDHRLPDPLPFYERNGYWTLGEVHSTTIRNGKRYHGRVLLVSRVQLSLDGVA
jgi:GNAT superfamily N-acetyltransferase